MAHAKIPAKIDADVLIDTLSREVFDGMTLGVHIEIELGATSIVASSVEEAAELIMRIADDRRKAMAKKAAEATANSPS